MNHYFLCVWGGKVPESGRKGGELQKFRLNLTILQSWGAGKEVRDSQKSEAESTKLRGPRMWSPDEEGGRAGGGRKERKTQ